MPSTVRRRPPTYPDVLGWLWPNCGQLKQTAHHLSIPDRRPFSGRLPGVFESYRGGTRFSSSHPTRWPMISRRGRSWNSSLAELPEVVLQSGACPPRGARRIEVWLRRLRISSANGVGRHRDGRSRCESSELSIELRTKPSLGRRHLRSTFLFDGSRTPRTARGFGSRSLPRWRYSAGSEVEGPPSRGSSPSASLPRVSTCWRSRSRPGRGPDRADPARFVTREIEMPASSSFPSGHAASAFAFAYAVGRHLPYLAIRSGCSPGPSRTHEST